MGIEITDAELSEEGEISFESQFKDGEGKPGDALRAMVAIVKKDETGIYPVGTGFFITICGHFVTAKHVFYERDGSLSKNLWGLEINRSTGKIILTPVKGYASHTVADLAVGYLQKEPALANKVMKLTTKIPPVGELVKTWSFPQPEKTEVDEKRSQIKYKFMAHAGNITEYFPNGRDRNNLPYECYEVAMDIKSGSSGGAVCFGSGSVFGINSSSFNIDDGGPPIGYITSIHALLDFYIPKQLFPENIIEEDYVTIRQLIERKIVACDDIS